MSRQEIQSQKAIIISSIIISILLIVTVSYAFFNPIISGTSYTTSGKAKSDAPNITFTEENTGFNLNNTYPMTDSEGLATTPYKFSITNNESKPIKYTIYLETDSANTLDNSLVKVSLEGTTKLLTSYTSANPTFTGYDKSYTLVSNANLDANGTKSYSLYGWIDESGTTANSQNKTWTSKIRLVASLA